MRRKAGGRSAFDRAVSSERVAWRPGRYGFSMFRLDEKLGKTEVVSWELLRFESENGPAEVSCVCESAAHGQMREYSGVCGHTSSECAAVRIENARIRKPFRSYQHRKHGCFLHDKPVMQSAVRRFASAHGNKGTARPYPH